MYIYIACTWQSDGRVKSFGRDADGQMRVGDIEPSSSSLLLSA